MDIHHQKESPLEDSKLQGESYSDKLSEAEGTENSGSPKSGGSWIQDVEQTIQLGEQFVGVVGGIVDLARAETVLAIRTFPKMLMLWLLMIPIILLTWCAFSALMAWSVYAASDEVGLGMLTFFLQQVLVLLVCCWWYVKYRARMTLPYTRKQIDTFLGSTKHELGGRNKEKE